MGILNLRSCHNIKVESNFRRKFYSATSKCFINIVSLHYSVSLLDKLKNAHNILTTQHTRDGTIVKVVYRFENILGKQSHREACCNFNILDFYSKGNHSG